MKRRTLRWILWPLALLVVAVLAVIAWASSFMLDYSLTAYHRPDAEALERLAERSPQAVAWVDSVRTTGALHDTVVSIGGVDNHAIYVAAAQPTGRTALLVHGYHDCAMSMLDVASIYHRNMGCNVLLPDLPAHGHTPGDYVGMGWTERDVVKRWIDVAAARFGSADDAPRIVLHGVSMGASLVMNLAGDSLPTCVRCVVEDCGYTSVWDEFAYQLDQEFGLPPFPLLYTTSALSGMKLGWRFGEASSIDALRHATVPVLMIHGSADDFVPTAMVYRLNDAYHGPAHSMWVVPGVDHARSFSTFPQEYASRVEQFVAPWLR